MMMTSLFRSVILGVEFVSTNQPKQTIYFFVVDKVTKHTSADTFAVGVS